MLKHKRKLLNPTVRYLHKLLESTFTGSPMTLHYFAVGCGGALGAIARVALSKLLPATILGIPFSILGINVLGCLVMGILVEVMALYLPVSETTRYFLISGLLGGFTTFSAFALEFGLLFEKSQYFSAIIYASLSVILSISLFFLGIKIVRFFPLNILN